MTATAFVAHPRRLGPHHFAYLRSLAEGLDPLPSAQRYLGIEHGHEARSAHRAVVERVRAIGRRHAEPAWRLIGVLLKPLPETQLPSLEDFIASRELDGWSQSEQIALYLDAYPLDAKSQRRQRLRARLLALLQKLEAAEAVPPRPEDLVSGWFDEPVARKLIAAGLLNLGALSQAIARGGRWYAHLPGIGAAKATRLASYLRTLLPEHRSAGPGSSVGPRLFVLPGPSSGTAPRSPELKGPAAVSASVSAVAPPTVVSAPTAPAPPPGSLLAARNDTEAVQTWVRSHAGSQATAKSYWRQARIFLLWLQHERAGKPLMAVDVQDCLDFKAFVAHPPEAWISRARARPGQAGWAPFRGPLSEASQHHLLNIVGALFAFLKLAGHIPSNPWPLIKTRAAMKRTARTELDSRALSLRAQQAVESFLVERLQRDPSGQDAPAIERMLFVLRFVSGVGLRVSELLGARLADVQPMGEGHVMRVLGKGGKVRLAVVPPQALAALQHHLQARGQGPLERADPQLPLLASLKDPRAPVGYQALYLTVRTWLRRAIMLASDIGERDRHKLSQASSHWLRHTFATRAIERGVPMEVVQAQMGHAHLSTTMTIYARAPIERQIHEVGKAFSD